MGGADWPSERVNVGGMPPYDNYLRNSWVMPRQEYLQRHNLDPQRKLLAYASSFVSWSPNIQNVEALVNLVASDKLSQPTQLLVRLHPIHMSGHYVSEADRIRQLAQQHEHVHVIEPTPMGSMGFYGEDVIERTSMMAHADIFLTVYSTMCVEASFQQRPIISVCIDAKEGYPGKFWVPMSEIGVWPTHSRFRASDAGRIATNEEALQQAINEYLENPQASLAAQKRFLEQECTYIDGSASQRTAQYILSLLEKSDAV
jgi:CDP-glycerol glycerophosphotransferase (TagB/SpsB family)